MKISLGNFYIDIGKNKKETETSATFWQFPTTELLEDTKVCIDVPDEINTTQNIAKSLNDRLRTFGIRNSFIRATKGNTIKKYLFKLHPEVCVDRVKGMKLDLEAACWTSVGNLRITFAILDGENYMSFEYPNPKRTFISFKESIQAAKADKNYIITSVNFGKDVENKNYIYDLKKAPNMLIGGAVGSGKTIFLHNILMSFLYNAKPNEVKLILSDIKSVEFTLYKDIPHLLCPVLENPESHLAVLQWLVKETSVRWDKFAEMRVRNIEEYNEKMGYVEMPYLFFIVDEFNDVLLQNPVEIEKSVVRLASLTRSSGIHFILSSHRPTTDVMTGLIKANIPARVAFNVINNDNSKVIIDQSGAQRLLGKGDMLFLNLDISDPVRLQVPMVTQNDIKNVTDFIKNQGVVPTYNEELLAYINKTLPKEEIGLTNNMIHDELFDIAVEMVQKNGRASASLLQTSLSIGYARAARIMDQLKSKGIVDPENGNILVPLNEPSERTLKFRKLFIAALKEEYDLQHPKET